MQALGGRAVLAEGSSSRKAAPDLARPQGSSVASTELGGHPAIGLSPVSPPPAGPAFGPGAAGGPGRCAPAQPRPNSRPSGKGSQGLTGFSYLLEGWFGLKGQRRGQSREVVVASPFLFWTSRAPAREEPPAGPGAWHPPKAPGCADVLQAASPHSSHAVCRDATAMGCRRRLKAATMRAALAKELAWLRREAAAAPFFCLLLCSDTRSSSALGFHPSPSSGSS